jgi:hypothetical protein
LSTTTAEKTGKGKYGDRESVVCYALDAEKLNEINHAYLTAVYGPIQNGERILSVRQGEWVALRVKDDGNLPGRAWAKGRKGETWAMIHTEGVGYVADEYNVIEFPVFGMMGNNTRCQVYVGRIEDLQTGEMVDLADHIRVFGDRLESNFSLWASHAI